VICKMIKENNFKKYVARNLAMEEMQQQAKAFYELMNERRSLRHFSDQAVPKEIIENIIMTASTAPSGAHKQPWSFCAVSSAEIKRKIRVAAEQEEYDNYHGRMSDTWLEDLKPFATDEYKPFLETAPWLIVLFKKAYDLEAEERKKNYYVNESVGIAAGMLLTAIHFAGLVSLTHTPSPMNFLQKVLDRPDNERAFLLIPVGYPAKDAEVPVLERKPMEEVLFYY